MVISHSILLLICLLSPESILHRGQNGSRGPRSVPLDPERQEHVEKPGLPLSLVGQL